MASELVPENLIGHHVLDSDGDNVGKIKQVFLDDRTGEPSWVSVHTGLFGMRETLVPLQGAQPVEEDIQVPDDKATVKDAPHVNAERHISPEDEATVREHFARHREVPRQGGGEADSFGGPPTGEPIATDRPPSEWAERDMEPGMGTAQEDPVAGPAGMGVRPETPGERTEERLGLHADEDAEEISVVRHEEEVDIGVERRESGQARMHKTVESERFDETVPLHHDELEVERRPITDPSEVAEEGVMEEEEETFTLYEERPVVSKKQVPVEQVRVRKRDVSHEEHVEGERRRERIEFEGEDEDPTT